jgi:plastocyanin
VGASDTAVATSGSSTARAPISVTQVVASILVSTTGSDTLRTTGRTKQYAAIARDSQSNTIGGTTITWSSSLPAVASVVTGTGLATALTDGTANIVASAGTVTGQRAVTVRRFASTFTFSPPSATIVTPLGTQIFLGTVEDSVATPLPITWTSRTPATLALLSATGPQITARAAGNGTSYVVIQGGTRSDSALVTVSGQATAPLTATVLVGAGNIFSSQRNLSNNPAVDTIAVGGVVTWQGQGGNHTAQSQGSPSFTSSGTLGTGTYLFTFAVAGTYQYDCAIHGSIMTGRIVVR